MNVFKAEDIDYVPGNKFNLIIFRKKILNYL